MKRQARAPADAMYYTAKCRAKRNNIPFNLKRRDVIVPALCPILGIALEVRAGGPGDASPSLDRIDPALGYVRGNVWVISHKANRMKSNASVEELQRFANWVLTEL